VTSPGYACAGPLPPGAIWSFALYLVALNIGDRVSREVIVADGNSVWRRIDVTGREGES
jgi:hypothetical protein